MDSLDILAPSWQADYNESLVVCSSHVGLPVSVCVTGNNEELCPTVFNMFTSSSHILNYHFHFESKALFVALELQQFILVHFINQNLTLKTGTDHWHPTHPNNLNMLLKKYVVVGDSMIHSAHDAKQYRILIWQYVLFHDFFYKMNRDHLKVKQCPFIISAHLFLNWKYL